MAVSAPQSTLVQIQDKVRKITGRPDVTQLSLIDLNQYIQTFYVYDFPEHLRLFNLKETYTFNTQANIDSYGFDRNAYISVQPPLFVDGYQSFWSQSREQFYRLWPKIEFRNIAGVGTGLGGPYTLQVPTTPILRAQVRYNGTFDSSILVCAEDANGNTVSMIDNGTGNLVESRYATEPPVAPEPSLKGFVDYVTGQFTFVFFSVNNVPVLIPAGNPITVSTVPYTPGRPTSVLFFDDQFVVRPVPDSCYKISIEAWKNPLEFLANSDNPELNEWWQFIALGASLKVFEDQAEIEEYAKFLPIFEKYKLLIQRRTIVQQTNQRTSTIYEDQTLSSLYQNFHNRF